MGKLIINDVKLKRMVRDGKTVNHCAQYFGVSTNAIRKRLKGLDVLVGRALAMDSEKVERLAKDHFDTVEELQKIHASAAELLGKLEQAQRGEMPVEDLSHILGGRASLGELYLKVLGEVRKQIHLASEMSKHMASINEMQDAYRVIVGIIAEADPAVGRKVMEKLVERRALCSSLSLT